MQILIADDDEFALATAQVVLRKMGYQVGEARNGRQALDMLRTSSCRMVISDWVMPEMDGLDLCRRIREESLGRYVYVILLTSRDNPEDILKGMEAGADDFITKPFRPQELCARVRAGERLLALDTRDVTIFALAKLVESRDAETGKHLDRVRNYSRVLARHLAGKARFHNHIDSEFVRLLYLTSPLHDIGKVGIPDRVLLKPARLNEEEYAVMKTHTTIGGETLSAAMEHCPNVPYLRTARDIAMSHHERFDGGGYPGGLKGDAIPLSGRIVALADVYDAITSRRVYKEPCTHPVARRAIAEGAGTQFDPEVVEAFAENEDKFIAIRDGYMERDPAMA